MKLTFTRDAAGKPKISDDDLRAMHAALMKGPKLGAQIPGFVRDVAVERMQSEIRKLQAANERLTYTRAAQLVAAERPELQFFDRLDLNGDAGNFDIECEVAAGEDE